MDKEIFRQDPLEKLTSPEELQERLTIVSFKNWIALGVLAILLLCVILWSIFGKIPVIAEGKAIVFDTDRISFIYSEMSGSVVDLKVKQGEDVTGNQVLAVLGNSAIESEIREKKILITKLESYLGQSNGENSAQVEDRQIQLLMEQARLETLQFAMDQSIIKAPGPGKIIDVEIVKGERVEPGKVLMWLQAPAKPDQKINIYGILPFEDGSRIRAGMSVKVALSSIPLTQYGYLLGTVKEVFPYLTPLEPGPLTMFPSEELQAYVSHQKAFVIIKIEPLTDPKNPTHYQWTSTETPPYPIAEGVKGTVKVTLDIKRPISFLIPIK